MTWALSIACFVVVSGFLLLWFLGTPHRKGYSRQTFECPHETCDFEMQMISNYPDAHESMARIVEGHIKNSHSVEMKPEEAEVEVRHVLRLDDGLKVCEYQGMIPSGVTMSDSSPLIPLCPVCVSRMQVELSEVERLMKNE